MKKPRFSLLSILLLTGLIGAVLAWGLSRRELMQLRHRHEQVLEQTGFIHVRDPTKVHVRQLDCPAPQTWRYQIYLPAGHELESGLGVELNEKGWPTRLLDAGSLPESRQITLTVSLHHQDQKWRLSRYTATGGSDYRLVATDFSWLQEHEHQLGYSKRAENSLHGPVRQYEPDETIILLRLQNQEQPSPGDGSLLLWFEPKLRSHYRQPTAEDTLTAADEERERQWQRYLLRK